jgi:hypothetical protein
VKLSLQSAVGYAVLLSGMILAYADLKYGVADLRQFREQAAAKLERLQLKAERLEVWVSHAQSWADEEMAQ